MRIVTRVIRQIQVSAGGVYDLGCRVVWCPKYRCPVLTDQVAGRCEELIRTKVSEHGWPMVALAVMPGHVHLLAKAHPSNSPSWIASQFTGFTPWRLRAGFRHMRSRLPAWWPWSYCAATAGALSAQTGCRYTGRHDERPWRKDRPL